MITDIVNLKLNSSFDPIEPPLDTDCYRLDFARNRGAFGTVGGRYIVMSRVNHDSV